LSWLFDVLSAMFIYGTVYKTDFFSEKKYKKSVEIISTLLFICSL